MRVTIYDTDWWTVIKFAQWTSRSISPYSFSRLHSTCFTNVTWSAVCLRTSHLDFHNRYGFWSVRVTISKTGPRTLSMWCSLKCIRLSTTVAQRIVSTYIIKAVPLQAWSGPEGSRKLKFPDYMATAQDGSKTVSLTHRPPLPTGNAPGTHFC
jgi:hypothetical protein